MSATTEPGVPVRGSIHAVGDAFKRASVALRKLRGRETHRPGQLSYAQLSLLFGLANGCELSARGLADAAALTPATVTQMLEGLEASGYVERTRSQTDKRVVLTKLTDRGDEVVRQRRTKMEAHWAEALSRFSDDQLAASAEVLNTLATFFEEFDRTE